LDKINMPYHLLTMRREVPTRLLKWAMKLGLSRKRSMGYRLTGVGMGDMPVVECTWHVNN
jgi:hypothetical protein